MALSCRRGFTLVELLLAMGTFAIAMATLPAVLISTMRANNFARRMTVASTFAQDRLEAIRNTPYASVTGGSDVVTQAGTTHTYTRTWSVTSGPTATTRRVAVTVSWQDRGSRQVTLNSLVSG